MTNGTNGHSPQQGLGLIEIADKLVRSASKAVSFLGKTLKSNKGVSSLILIVAIAFVAGGLTWNFVQQRPSSHTQQKLSPHDPTMAAAVPIVAKVPNVGLLDGVTVTNEWTKQLPGHSTQSYMIGIKFSKPDDCADNSCSVALTDIFGEDVSCEAQECSAELTDVDEGAKVNSADIWEQCSLYEQNSQKVFILFSGVREQANSNFANVLLIGPSVR